MRAGAGRPDAFAIAFFCIRFASAVIRPRAAPAQAFTTDNSVTVSGVRYYAKAYSCNVYWRSCSWNSSISISRSKAYTHRADVKANGFSLSISISSGGGVTITGNSTSLVTASRSSYGTSSYMAGVAKPSIFSVSVAARTRGSW